MTKEELKEIANLKKQVKELKKEVKSLKLTADDEFVIEPVTPDLDAIIEESREAMKRNIARIRKECGDA
tara:strand:+ start:44 stop:250 length:207 start_codon:yes stop_codon:yes gene_type:complete